MRWLGSQWRSQSEAGQQCIQSKMVGHWLTKLSRLGRGVGVENHVEHPSHDQQAEKVGIVGQMTQHREDEYVYEAFGELSVIKSADAGNKTQDGSQSRTGRTRGGLVYSRWRVLSGWRHGAFQASRQTILAIDHAAN